MKQQIKNWLVRFVMRKRYVDLGAMQRAKDKGIVLVW